MRFTNSMFKASVIESGNGGKTNKILKPGKHNVQVIKITLDQPNYVDPLKDSVNLNVLVMSTEKVEHDFEGIARSKEDPSLGKYPAPIATVGSSKYPVSTYTYEGRIIEKDTQIFNWVCKFLNTFEITLSDGSIVTVHQKMIQDGVEAATIEDYIFQCNKYLAENTVLGDVVIGGKEYYNSQGYINHNLFFPQTKAGDAPVFGSKNVREFNYDTDVIKAPKPADPSVNTAGTASSPF